MPHSIQCVHSSHTRTHVHMRARAYERAHARMHTCMCANARIGRTSRIEGHARACTHVRARLGTHTRICICSRIRIHIRIHIQMHPHPHPHSNASASASTFKCIRTCIRIRFRVQAHMRTSTYVRMHAPTCAHAHSINPKLGTQVCPAKMHPQPARHTRRTSGFICKIYFWSKSLQVQLGDLRRCLGLGAEPDLASGGSWGLI
jgi:hypothetical protein